ncbi:MAG: SCO1664 family protein [Actinomycetota bacterium]|nr:SCO1664 family protein [Actinomycetota bacterium]
MDSAGAQPTTLSVADALELLRDGELDVEGRLVDASNASFYCTISLNGVAANCVYKPVRGERPLWDFPGGTLAGREVAAYLLSTSTGWEIVPPTVLREGPFGPGMCQLWMEPDQEVDLVALVRSEHPDLRRMAVFDAVANNADRKGGHLLAQPDGHVYGCDHGVCFHAEDKLRTLLWRWAGQRLPEEAMDVLTSLESQLAGQLGEQLRSLLSRAEVSAAIRRVERLLRMGRYPEPSEDWPPVPWPPF